ncbi:MAG: hypothetical protein CVT80_00415 [Alphaproteobacteria bacterium HGW-Alphaproteobacteria-2]|nr:MAG: hypothetical protein CVT80_00415 [Alphaproteobacteria bacterium HGW-Alphaproteobacteria-2]
MGIRLSFRPCDDDRVLADWAGLSGLDRLGAMVLCDAYAERRRQIEAEYCTPQLDDEWEERELADMAACYILHAGDDHAPPLPHLWPETVDAAWWKPSTERRDLVKAAALILAEIERLDRAAWRAKRNTQVAP